MAKKAVEAVPEQPKFKLSILRENAVKLFDCSSATFAGATCDLDADGEYTVAEIKVVIADWLKKEVM